MQLQLKKMMNYLEAKLTNGKARLIAVKSGKLVRFEEKKHVRWEEQLLEFEELL
jgi:hypothetical protein